MPTSFNYPLQTSDYNTLRGTGTVPQYGGAQYASMCPNTVIFAAQFNSAQSGNSYAQEEWHNATTGAYTDALPGQRFLASATNSQSAAYFTGRVRKAFGATTTYFNETSISQNGNDYIWVLDDYPIMDKLLRYLEGSAQYFFDYDISYRPLLPLAGSANDAVGLKGAYAGFVDPNNSNKFRISISVLFYPSESAATITAWSVDIRDGSLHSGSISGSGTTTGTITIDFPAGFRWIHIAATNSAGTSSTLNIPVWAEVRSGSTTLLTGFNGATIGLDVSSPGSQSSCSLEMFTTELNGVLNNTLICVWDEEYLNNTLGSVGGNVRYVGRLRKEQDVAKSDDKFVRTLSTRYTLEGPDTQLARLDGLKFGMVDNIAASSIGQVKSFNPYRAIALLITEFTTLCNSVPMNFDNYDDTFPYPAINTSGSTMLGTINDVGMSLNGYMQFSGDGRASFSRHAFYLSNAQRNALNTVANWTDQDRTSDMNLQLDQLRQVAQVDAWGGETIGTPQVVPLHSEAPGLARDVGDKSIQLLKQILANVGVAAAQTELNDRAGCHWFMNALQTRLGNLTHPPGYGFLNPDIGAWYTWTISASDNLRGISYSTSTRWILEKLSTTHDNTAASKKVTPTYLVETNGIGFGNTIAIITSNTLPPADQNLALQVYPLTTPVVPPIEMPGPDAATLKSGISKLALILNDGTRTTTTNFQQTPPTWTTPASLGVSGTPLQWVPDFHSGYLAGGGAGTKTYGWIVTTTGVYYGDINTPSFTLGHSFRATSSLRSASASLVQAGHIVVVTDYSDGTYVTYATTGANWTGESSLGAGAGSLPPGCWYSQHTALVVYTSVNGTGYKSTDGGGTWSTFATIDPGSDCATDIAVPYPGGTDSIFYYVKSGATQTIDYDMLTSDNGFVQETPADNAGGVWAVGQGWRETFFDGFGGDPNAYRSITILLTLPATYTLKHFKATYSLTSGTYSGFTSTDRIWYNSSSAPNWLATQARNNGAPGPQGAQSLEWTGTQSGVTIIGFLATAGIASSHGVDPGGSVQLTDITIDIDASGTRKLMRLTVDVSPLSGYAPWKTIPQISLSLANANIIGVAAGDSSETNAGIFISQDGGNSWSQLVAPTTDGSSGRYDWIPMSGNSSPVLYPAGSKGRIGYSASLAGPIVDKRGNLSTSASVIGLAGFRS